MDTVLSAPLAQLGMIPVLTLIAVHAPEGRQATWFALVASLMNLALQAGSVFSRGLNAVFPVERGDYASLPALVIAATVAGLALALGAIALLGPWVRPTAAAPRPSATDSRPARKRASARGDAAAPAEARQAAADARPEP